MARAILSRGVSSPTVQPTVLVHELYMQLPDVQRTDWQSRAHFMNVAAKMMRNILIDLARQRKAAKRGGDAETICVTDVPQPGGNTAADAKLDVLAVNDALDELEKQYPRHAKVVELRFFGGLSSIETAEVLSAEGTATISLRTVERDWTFARAWLQDRLANSR